MRRKMDMRCRCILFYFYIKPQLYSKAYSRRYRCILFYFYIKPQLSFLHLCKSVSCILFYFYIKPQLIKRYWVSNGSCILFYFYIKPQRTSRDAEFATGCILFYFYIKPQLQAVNNWHSGVVYYSISTSNHNKSIKGVTIYMLYIILFLHQTTTVSFASIAQSSCILFYFYIKPQRSPCWFRCLPSCILFYFYIKPQLIRCLLCIC